MRKLLFPLILLLSNVLNAQEAKPNKIVDTLTNLVKQKRPSKDVTKFYQYLANNIPYSYIAGIRQIQGNLVVNFNVVDKEIDTIKIDPILGYNIEEELLPIFAKYKGQVLEDENYSIMICYRIVGSSTPILNENARLKEDYTHLRPVTIQMSFSRTPPALQSNKVFDSPGIEFSPIYPGGMDRFSSFLKENIKHPTEAIKAEISGKVYVSFIIEKDGKLTDIKIDRGLGYGTDEEAIRVLKMSERWIPGIDKGYRVRTRYNMPIMFNIPNKTDGEIKP